MERVYTHFSSESMDGRWQWNNINAEIKAQKQKHPKTKQKTEKKKKIAEKKKK